MFDTIDVIGATVVTTCNLPPPNGPDAGPPAVEAAAGQANFATNAFADALSSFAPVELLLHATSNPHNEPATTAVDIDLLRRMYTPVTLNGLYRYCELHAARVIRCGVIPGSHKRRRAALPERSAPSEPTLPERSAPSEPTLPERSAPSEPN